MHGQALCNMKQVGGASAGRRVGAGARCCICARCARDHGMSERDTTSGPPALYAAREVFRVALLLGLTSFGGPIAHLGYYEREYVQKRHWLRPEEYASLVALCQMLPGPTSSQVGFLVGL